MEKKNQQNQLNIRNLISSTFRQKYIVIIIIPVITLATYSVLLFQTRVYEASVKMHIVGKAQVTTEFYYDIGAGSLHQTQMEIVKSNTVLKRAVVSLKLDKRPFDYEKNFCHPIKKFLIEYKIKKLNKEIEYLSPEKFRDFCINYAIDDLKDNLTTKPIPGTDLFEIVVKDFNADTAISISNVISRSYIIFDLQQQLAELTQKYGFQHPSIQQLRDNIYSMTEKLSGEQLSEFEAYGTGSVKIIEQASSSRLPVGKPKLQIFLIAIIASVVVGIGLAIAIDIFVDQTFKSPTEIVKFTGLPLLGSIPVINFKNNLLLDTEKFNPSKLENSSFDFLEDLSDQLLIYMKVNKQKSILITSAYPKGGATTICANIGMCLSQRMGVKTLIVDANFRNPMIHKLFNLNESTGIANMLEEGRLIEYHSMLRPKDENNDPVIITDKMDTPYKDKNFPKQVKIKTSEILHHINNKLDILQAGKAAMNPITLLNDTKIDAIFKLVKADYDAVIVDCTNLKEYKDTGILSSHVDGIALIVNDGKERRQLVQNSMSYIKQKKGNLIGVILNRRRFPIPEIIYKWL